MEFVKKIINCRACDSSNLSQVYKFNDCPIEGDFVTSSNLDKLQPEYPMSSVICNDCGFLQLEYLLSPEIIYKNYYYETAATTGLIDHFAEYSKKIVNRFSLKPNKSLVIDIGSNDGGFLNSFKNQNIEILGIEPSHDISKVANEKGINTFNSYFDNMAVDYILKNYEKASLVTSNYMFANIDNINMFINNVSKILDDNGVYIIETGYHPDQMNVNMIDWFYHEHFSYFTAKVLDEIMIKSGMKIFDYDNINIRGGCIRFYCKKIINKAIDINSNVNDLIKNENDSGMHKKETHINYFSSIINIKNTIKNKLSEYKTSGKKIVGYGASHSTTGLMYLFELSDYIEYLVDDNPAKLNKFSPGKHKKIFNSTKITEDNPDVIIILAWLYTKPILKNLTNFIDNGGEILIPLPEFKIIKN
tara:strand:- start:25897 stop:27147 length:1251 start_codon:yes stop_codon:yes gene_type:complete